MIYEIYKFLLLHEILLFLLILHHIYIFFATIFHYMHICFFKSLYSLKISMDELIIIELQISMLNYIF